MLKALINTRTGSIRQGWQTGRADIPMLGESCLMKSKLGDAVLIRSKIRCRCSIRLDSASFTDKECTRSRISAMPNQCLLRLCGKTRVLCKLLTDKSPHQVERVLLTFSCVVLCAIWTMCFSLKTEGSQKVLLMLMNAFGKVYNGWSIPVPHAMAIRIYPSRTQTQEFSQ